MDGVGELALDNEGLETAFQELGNGKTKHVIELALRVLEETKTHHAADKGLTFEKTALIVSGEGEQSTGSLTELGEGQLGSPDLLLAAETVGTNETKPIQTRTIKDRTFRQLFKRFSASRVLGQHLLVDKLLLLEGTSGGIEGR